MCGGFCDMTKGIPPRSSTRLLAEHPGVDRLAELPRGHLINPVDHRPTSFLTDLVEWHGDRFDLPTHGSRSDTATRPTSWPSSSTGTRVALAIDVADAHNRPASPCRTARCRSLDDPAVEVDDPVDRDSDSVAYRRSFGPLSLA